MFSRRSVDARLRAKGVQGALPPGRGGLGEPSSPPGKQGDLGVAGPPILYLAKPKIKVLPKLICRVL